MIVWSSVAASRPQHVEYHVVFSSISSVLLVLGFLCYVRQVGGEVAVVSRGWSLCCAHLSGHRRNYHIDVQRRLCLGAMARFESMREEEVSLEELK